MSPAIVLEERKQRNQSLMAIGVLLLAGLLIPRVWQWPEEKEASIEYPLIRAVREHRLPEAADRMDLMVAVCAVAALMGAALGYTRPRGGILVVLGILAAIGFVSAYGELREMVGLFWDRPTWRTARVMLVMGGVGQVLIVVGVRLRAYRPGGRGPGTLCAIGGAICLAALAAPVIPDVPMRNLLGVAWELTTRESAVGGMALLAKCLAELAAGGVCLAGGAGSEQVLRRKRADLALWLLVAGALLGVLGVGVLFLADPHSEPFYVVLAQPAKASAIGLGVGLMLAAGAIDMVLGRPCPRRAGAGERVDATPAGGA